MFNNPGTNLLEFGLAPGMLVADLGVGGGYYALAVAKLVGKQGKVIGIDVQKELVENLKREAALEGLDNVEALWSDLEKPGGAKIKDDALDAILITSVLFVVEDKNAFIAEAKRILKPGGKALVIDWRDSFAGLGPHPEHVLSEPEAKKLFEGAGFTVEKSVGAGDHHYGFIAKKNG